MINFVLAAPRHRSRPCELSFQFLRQNIYSEGVASLRNQSQINKWLQILLSSGPLCSRPARLLPAEGWGWVLPVLLRRQHRTGPRSQHSFLFQKPSWAKHGEQPGRWTPGHHNAGIRCQRQIGSKSRWLYIYRTLNGCIFELADGLLTGDKSSVWEAELVISNENRGHE